MGHYEGGHNGGKLPEKFRQAFQDAVEAFVVWQFDQTPEPTVWFDDEHGEIPLSRICGLVWNCTDRLPLEVMARISWLADDGKLIGSTYACGARGLLRLIEWRRSLDQPPCKRPGDVHPEPVQPRPGKPAAEGGLEAQSQPKAGPSGAGPTAPGEREPEPPKTAAEVSDEGMQGLTDLFGGGAAEGLLSEEEFSKLFDDALEEAFGPHQTGKTSQKD
jgi:hypothetical protein